jgi:hypothetical protein
MSTTTWARRARSVSSRYAPARRWCAAGAEEDRFGVQAPARTRARRRRIRQPRLRRSRNPLQRRASAFRAPRRRVSAPPHVAVGSRAPPTVLGFRVATAGALPRPKAAAPRALHQRQARCHQLRRHRGRRCPRTSRMPIASFCVHDRSATALSGSRVSGRGWGVPTARNNSNREVCFGLLVATQSI